MVQHIRLQKEYSKKYGINYKIIENKPDGTNINRNCGSTYMKRISEFVTENGLSMGISYDGDGDRCLAVDENGKIVDGDTILAIFAKYMKEKNLLKNDTIVATVMSNVGLNKFANENNLKLKQTNVGDRYVLEEMLKNGYNLGGEQSGHIILLDYNPTGDGILTSLMLSMILLESNTSLAELKKSIKIFPQILVNAKVSNDKKYLYKEDEEICSAIKKVESEYNDNGRVLIRPSGTESLIRIMIEGEDEVKMKQSARTLAELIEKRLN